MRVFFLKPEVNLDWVDTLFFAERYSSKQFTLKKYSAETVLYAIIKMLNRPTFIKSS